MFSLAGGEREEKKALLHSRVRIQKLVLVSLGRRLVGYE
jgi:hypothetical protein